MTAEEARTLGEERNLFLTDKLRIAWYCGRLNKEISRLARLGYTGTVKTFNLKYYRPLIFYIKKCYDDLGYKTTLTMTNKWGGATTSIATAEEVKLRIAWERGAKNDH